MRGSALAPSSFNSFDCFPRRRELETDVRDHGRFFVTGMPVPSSLFTETVNSRWDKVGREIPPRFYYIKQDRIRYSFPDFIVSVGSLEFRLLLSSDDRLHEHDQENTSVELVVIRDQQLSPLEIKLNKVSVCLGTRVWGKFGLFGLCLVVVLGISPTEWFERMVLGA
jgi:hypothetical protein